MEGELQRSYPTCGSQPQAPDHWHVNLDEPWEIQFWCRELGCRARELREAVHAVGPRSRNVRAYLESQRRQTRS